ncbi:MAG: hypothetical protein JWP34_2965 [Massilia sp.]|nr:hypothetical protein [Massilia sp.]
MENISIVIIAILKTILRRSTLAALLAAASIHASEDKPAPPPAAKPSVLMETIMSMARELKVVTDPGPNPVAHYNALANFRHSPETAEKLAKAFGSERPWSMVRVSGPKGQHNYLGKLVPLHYTGKNGGRVDSAELSVRLSLDSAGRTMAMRGAWPLAAMEDKDLRITMRDMTLVGKQKRGFGDLWFGNVQLDFASIKFDAKGPGVSVTMDDIRTSTAFTERPKSMEIAYGVTMKSIEAAGERVDGFKLALRVTNIDKATMVELKALADKSDAAALSPEQKLAAMKPMMKTLASAAIKHGTAVEIDQISARYLGNTASLKGRVGLEGATEADLDALPALVKKIAARFEIKVPVALVRDISTTIARKQASAQSKGPANPQTVAQIAQGMSDIVLGKLLGNGYARIENDVLLSNIEFRGGVLRINGKEVALPAAGPAAPQPPASVGAAVRSTLLQARRIEGRCTLPDYPEEVVRLDQPLSLTLRFMVNADGSLRDLAMAAPSQSPAYDQAVLAAAARCVFIPALRDGKPVAVPMTWQVMRAPGSTRP